MPSERTPVTVRSVAADRPEVDELLDAYLDEREATFPSAQGSYSRKRTPVAEFTPPRGTFVVAYDGEVAVGCGGLRRIADDGDDVRFEVKHVFVAPEGRGKGVATAVMDALETAAAELGGTAIVVDVTVPALSPAIVTNALDSGANVLVGTSGWSEARLASLRTALAERPEQGAFVVPNFSIGSVLGTHLATIAAPWFPSIEIVETHHAGKIDSPSGTAVRTAELISAARREVGPVDAPHVDQRARGQQVASVPIHSLRLPGVKAVQDVVLSGPGETLTIRHDTNDDVAYAPGIRAALSAVGTVRGLTVGLGSVLGIG